MTISTRFPLKSIAAQVSKWTGFLTAAATAAAGWGILTAAQGDAVTGLLGAVPGVLAWVGTALAAFGVAGQGEPLVTPVADPRDNSNRTLSAHSQPGDFGSGLAGG